MSYDKIKSILRQAEVQAQLWELDKADKLVHSIAKHGGTIQAIRANLTTDMITRLRGNDD